MLPFKLKSLSVLYTEKLKFPVTEWFSIACWTLSIIFKENNWLRTVKISKKGYQIMIFPILLNTLYCKLKTFFIQREFTKLMWGERKGGQNLCK